MKKLSSSLICILFLITNPTFAQDKGTIGDDIKKVSISIDTVKLYEGSNQYARSVYNKLKEFKVLGIGEQTHGTHEFFQTKKALITKLIQEYGYNLIGLEAPFAEVENLNNYVLEGKGDLREILKSFRQYTFECSEFESFVEGIRDSNRKTFLNVKFFGFDFQSPFASLQYLHKVNQLHRGKQEEEIQLLAKAFTKLSNQLYSHSIDSSEFSELKTISSRVINELQVNARSDVMLFQYIENYKQFLELNSLVLKADSISMSKISLLRDSLMALNVLNKINKGKILLWAHNSHLQKTPSIYSKSMGYFLKEKLKEEYAVIGQTTSKGYFTAFDPRANKVTNRNLIIIPGVTDFESIFSSTGMSVFFFETNNFKTKLLQSNRYRMLGYGATDRQFVEGNIFADFDFILHVEQSSGNNSFYLK